MMTSEPDREVEYVKWCLHEGCLKTQVGSEPWKVDHHRKTMVDIGVLPSMMAPFCDEHKAKKKPEAA